MGIFICRFLYLKAQCVGGYAIFSTRPLRISSDDEEAKAQ
jgi:hypothetical protein